MDIKDANQSKPHLYQKNCAFAATSTTAYAKQKLIQILQKEISILYQRWRLDKILTVLIIH